MISSVSRFSPMGLPHGVSSFKANVLIAPKFAVLSKSTVTS